MVEKQCRRCGQTKSSEEFPPNTKLRDGLHSYCRECCRAANRGSRAKRAAGRGGRRGRPSKFSPDTLDAFVDAFRSGATVEAACAAAQVSASTYWAWFKRGDPAGQNPADARFRTFRVEVQRVRAEVERARDWPRRAVGKCSIEGCENVHSSRGWCGAHYRRWRLYGDPLGSKSRGPWRHGHSSKGRRSATYRSWASMLRRCLTPSAGAYPRYGGRGITVCDRWRSFENFLADMGPRPEWATGGIDRIDNSGNYEPGNCRWATSAQQRANQGA